MYDKEYNKSWHFDRRVPIALISVTVFQTLCVVWWAATAAARLDFLERSMMNIAPQAGQIIRLETKVDMMSSDVSKIKGAIEAHQLK